MGIPDLYCGVATGGDDVLPPATELNVINPVGVVLHGLEVGFLGVAHVPYSNDAVPASAIKPLEVVVILKRVDPGSVTPLPLLPDDEGHLHLPPAGHGSAGVLSTP